MLVPVPPGLDPAQAVSLVLNYTAAYQMMYRSSGVQRGQRAQVHGAAGGVGTALLQLGRLAGLEMYGACSPRGAETVSRLGGTPIDYGREDWEEEVHRLTGDGVDGVFDPIGGNHLWQSRPRSIPPHRGPQAVAHHHVHPLRGAAVPERRPVPAHCPLYVPSCEPASTGPGMTRSSAGGPPPCDSPRQHRFESGASTTGKP